MAYKTIEPIPFGEKLYLDRYLDTDDKDILDKREEVFEWKNQIRTLKETKSEILKVDEESKLNIVDALSVTKKYLESIQGKAKEGEVESQEVSPAAAVSDSTIEHLDSEISRLKNQIYEIDSIISEVEDKISGQFENYKKVAYSIFAVFIHRGEANYGHYWIYIRDPHQKNVFRKYNDEIVSEVPDTEVFNFVEGNTTTPYYIAYVREELEMDYVEPLKRIIRCS
jgi:ubiquitin carboxyl-terminal hydrolase 25/28